MHHFRRTFLRRVAAAALFATGCAAHAEAWPDKPIHLVVSYAAGGGVDNIARILAPPLGALLGQSIVIENRPGASANIGTDYVAKAPADGYTLLLGATYLAVNRASMAHLPYDMVTDLAPIARVGRAPWALVVSSQLPVKSVSELIAYGQAHPNDVSYATVGTASPPVLIFTKNAGIPAVPVLYKGGSQTLTDLMSTRVTYQLTTATEVLSYIKGGKLRALAVTGTERFKPLPDVPTFQDLGIGKLTNTGWWGMFAPAKTPAPVMDKLAAAMAEVLKKPEVIESLGRLGVDVAALPPKQFASFLQDEIQFHSAVAREFNIHVE